MALLSPAAIALLERLPETWTDLAELELDALDAALLELKREGCAETEIWPPPDPRRGSYRARGRAIDDAIRRWTRARRTLRGALRLQRIQAGRR